METKKQSNQINMGLKCKRKLSRQDDKKLDLFKLTSPDPEIEREI